MNITNILFALFTVSSVCEKHNIFEEVYTGSKIKCNKNVKNCPKSIVVKAKDVNIKTKFKFIPATDSEEHLESMINNARTLCDRLDLSSKLIQLSTGDIGFQSAITFDIEVWAAGSKEWLEVSSISNCYDFQSRRNNTRYKETQSSSTIFPHTLNGSGLALPRIWVAIIENGQQEDGSIKIPEVLIPYTGFDRI